MSYISGYQETYSLYCQTTNLEGDKAGYAAPIEPPCATMKVRTQPTTEEYSDCDYLEAEPIATIRSTTISTTTNAPCHHTPLARPCEITTKCPYAAPPTMPKTTATTWVTRSYNRITTKCPYATMPRTIGTTWMTSRIIKCVTPRPTIWNTKPCPTIQATTPKPCATTTTMRTTEKFTRCCNRPVTWLTTTEKIIPVSFLPFEPEENNVIIEREEEVPTKAVTFNPTDPPLVYPTTKDPPITYPTAKDPPITKSQTRDASTTNAQTVSAQTPDPQTTNVQIISPHPNAPNTDPIILVDPTTTYVPNTEENTDIVINKKPTQTRTPKNTESPEEIKSKETTENNSEIVVLKMDYDEKRSTWWYPTICPSNKCQRPLVWSTTTKPRRRWRN